MKISWKKPKATLSGGKFLVSLYAQVKRLKSKKAFEELANSLTDKDLNAILQSSKELRERFKLE